MLEAPANTQEKGLLGVSKLDDSVSLKLSQCVKDVNEEQPNRLAKVRFLSKRRLQIDNQIERFQSSAKQATNQLA